MKYHIVASSLTGVLLLYLLSRASANTDLFAKHYSLLLALSGALTLSLCVMVAYQVTQLLLKVRREVFGARLSLRLVMFFSAVAIIPGLFLYVVSVQFLGKSIESWFDVRVERALEGSLNLGRGMLENELERLDKKNQSLAMQLANQPFAQYRNHILHIIDRSEGQEVTVFDVQGKAILVVNGVQPALWRTVDAELVTKVFHEGSYKLIDAYGENRLMLRSMLRVDPPPTMGPPFVLHLAQPVAAKFAADAEMVQNVYRDYQQLTLSRLGLKRLYGITLTLTLVIVLLSAMSAALYLSDRLSAPLALLAERTRAVARGDYSPTDTLPDRDELSMLTGLFNQMTAQLAEANQQRQAQQRQLEHAKNFLESVLKHLSSGVLVLDEAMCLREMNHSAAAIIQIETDNCLGLSLDEIAARHALFRPIAAAIQQAYAAAQGEVWQKQLERPTRSGAQILLLKGMSAYSGPEKNLVVVLEDITHLLQTERQAAWGEVARRLAHEIKNPLTPIQLSAERLQHKLAGKLERADADLLQRATQTIVSQVQAMKTMVSEFADYARPPAPQQKKLDMHQLLGEVMGLYEANSIPIVLQLEARQTWLKGDPTRLRQVIHNLLHNAHDALQQTAKPQIVLRTDNPAKRLLQITVEDNGCGIAQDMLGRIFEPYMTTKSKGTGLGLAIVKKIVEEHGGHISMENIPAGGARARVLLPVSDEQEEA